MARNTFAGDLLGESLIGVDSTNTNQYQLSARSLGPAVAACWASSGPVNDPTGTDDLAPGVTTPASLAVTVNPGVLVARLTQMNAAEYVLREAKTFTDITAADPTLDRIDLFGVLVVLDGDTPGATLARITGSPAASPVAPAVTPNTATQLFIPVAQYRVRAGATVINADDVTDVRVFTSVRSSSVGGNELTYRSTFPANPSEGDTFVASGSTLWLPVPLSTIWTGMDDDDTYIYIVGTWGIVGGTAKQVRRFRKSNGVEDVSFRFALDESAANAADQNSDPSALIVTSTRIYVMDSVDEKGYAYDYDGALQSADNLTIGSNSEDYGFAYDGANFFRLATTTRFQIGGSQTSYPDWPANIRQVYDAAGTKTASSKIRVGDPSASYLVGGAYHDGEFFGVSTGGLLVNLTEPNFSDQKRFVGLPRETQIPPAAGADVSITYYADNAGSIRPLGFSSVRSGGLAVDAEHTYILAAEGVRRMPEVGPNGTVWSYVGGKWRPTNNPEPTL